MRLIDDLSDSLINKTVQCKETPRPHTADVIASVALSLLERSGDNILGKTFDLKSAYRQLGIHKGSLLYSYIACFDPVSRRPVVFQMLAVPFGATRAVYSFLRIARCLWWWGCKCLKLCWTNFYDDFVTFTGERLAGNTENAVALFFDLLGWQFAREGDKSSPFGSSFSALGIRVSLEHFTDGWVEFANTESRVMEVCGTIHSVLESGELCYKDAIRLRGRLQFADGQLFGRGKLCLNSTLAVRRVAKYPVDVLPYWPCFAVRWKWVNPESLIWLRVRTGSFSRMLVSNRIMCLGSVAWVVSW